MEYFWTLFSNSNGSSSRGYDGNCTTNHAWDSFDHLPTSRPDWNSSFNYPPPPPPPAASVGDFDALMVHNPDPHLTCLKLGKRHYFEDVSPPTVASAAAGGSFSVSKKGKSDGNGITAAAADTVVPRCQVDECEAVLVKAKDYHRRHKVCEMHAKAPRVVLLGIEQRFCQQCSRFHALGEFDEAKRSCRRRLAGHNERRRKSSHEHNSMARKLSQGRQSHFLNNGECALSLLSSSPWSHSTSPDLPAQCSAALRELIAENRASISAWRQLTNAHQIEGGSTQAGRPNPRDQSEGHVTTLNLMQAPSSAFGLLSVHDHKHDGEHDCSELWKVPLGY